MAGNKTSRRKLAVLDVGFRHDFFLPKKCGIWGERATFRSLTVWYVRPSGPLMLMGLFFLPPSAMKDELIRHCPKNGFNVLVEVPSLAEVDLGQRFRYKIALPTNEGARVRSLQSCEEGKPPCSVRASARPAARQFSKVGRQVGRMMGRVRERERPKFGHPPSELGTTSPPLISFRKM